jgi:hypothetical protein
MRNRFIINNRCIDTTISVPASIGPFILLRLELTTQTITTTAKSTKYPHFLRFWSTVFYISSSYVFKQSIWHALCV